MGVFAFGRGTGKIGRLLLKNGMLLFDGTGAPVNGTSGTAAGQAAKGSLYVNVTTGNWYQNNGTLASPTWDLTVGGGATLPSELGLDVINKTGVSIAANVLVATAGLDVTSGKPKIVLADADVAAHDDVWVTTEAIANNAAGLVVKSALSPATLNTNAVTSAGDPVYLDVTAGGFAVAAPTGATARVTPVGFVVVKSATIGQILWLIGPTRTIGTNELQARAVTAGKIAAAAGTILVGTKTSGDVSALDISAKGTIPVGQGAGETAAAKTLSGHVVMSETGLVTVQPAVITNPMLANGAGVGALLTAGLGGSASFLKTQDATAAVVAAHATKDRGTLVVAIVDETFADAGGTQPTFTVGEADTLNKFFVTGAFANKAAGTVLVAAGANLATKNISVTGVKAVGAGTGGLSVTVLAIPTT